MFRKLAGAIILSVGVFSSPVADACGVKFAPKAPHPRRVAAKTAAPSNVLLVGTPSKRLEHDLAQTGHHVEVTPKTSTAKQPNYDIVLVASNDQAADARQKFPGAAVIVRSGDEGADLRVVEDQARQRHMVGRAVIAAGPSKEQPVSTGSVQADTKVAAKAPDEQAIAAKQPDQKVAVKQPEQKVAAATPTPSDQVVAKAEPVKTEPVKTEPVRTEKVTAEPASKTPETAPSTKPEPATAAAIDEEVFFSLGSTSLGDTRKLDRAVRWLKANADVHAAVSGYADPSGTPEGNMTLSEQRANTVREYLVAHGIDAGRLDVTPFGDTKLKYGTHDGRNRRVEIEAKR